MNNTVNQWKFGFFISILIVGGLTLTIVSDFEKCTHHSLHSVIVA